MHSAGQPRCSLERAGGFINQTGPAFARAKAMRILIVNDYGVLSGGAERVSLILRDGLRKRGLEARLFASRAKPVEAPNPADYTCFGSESALMRVLQAVNPLAVWKLRQVLIDFRPDLVHVRMFKTQLSPFILPLFGNLPCIYHVGSLQSICPINTKILPNGSICRHKAGRECYHAGCLSSLGMVRVAVQHGAWNRWRGVFRAIVANSEWLARRLRDDGVEVSHVIHNGTPIMPARPRLQEPPTVAFAGRLVAEKGIGILLAAMVKVTEKIPACRLLLAGDGPYRAAVEEQLDRLKLRHHVSMPGYLGPDELAVYLQSAWVQVVPSSHEDPFPNVVIEAMMRGTAVVGTALGGTTEMIHDGKTGFLADPFDPSSLAEKLLCLLENRAAAEEMGAAGRGVALAEFTDHRMVEKFLTLYASLLGGPAHDTAKV